jgi:hypothetical protein
MSVTAARGFYIFMLGLGVEEPALVLFFRPPVSEFFFEIPPPAHESIMKRLSCSL